MITKRIKIINCYFGKLPAMFPWWLETCIQNKAVDFMIVTDQHIICNSDNIQIVNLTFLELKNIIAQKIPFSITLEKPYKLCDYKIAYGIIFSEYLVGYDFWGYCDNDMLFGKLDDYLNDELLETYPKILYLGHLSLYKNVEEINKLVITNNELFDWNQVYSGLKVCGIDEDNGIYRLYKIKNIPVYDKRIFFDIDPHSTYMRLDNKINKRMGRKRDTNYLNQVFVWQDGKVFRYYIRFGKIISEQAAYIHCGKNQIKKSEASENYNMLIFSKNCIHAIKKDKITKSDFAKYNRFSIINLITDWVTLLSAKVIRKIGVLRAR